MILNTARSVSIEALILLVRSAKLSASSWPAGLALLANWGLLARAQGDRKTEKEKLERALAIFTELKMPRQRDAVQKELDESRGLG